MPFTDLPSPATLSWQSHLLPGPLGQACNTRQPLRKLRHDGQKSKGSPGNLLRPSLKIQNCRSTLRLGVRFSGRTHTRLTCMNSAWKTCLWERPIWRQAKARQRREAGARSQQTDRVYVTQAMGATHEPISFHLGHNFLYTQKVPPSLGPRHSR